MVTFFSYRYIIPPFLFAMLIILAAIFSPYPTLIPTPIKELLKFESIVAAIFTFLAAGVIVLTLGFIIGTIPVFILRLIAAVSRKPRGLSVQWSEEEEKKLCQIYAIKNFTKEAEQAEHYLLGDIASEHVITWMIGRWEYYLININCFCSSIFAMIVTFTLPIYAPLWWWLTTSLLSIMFFFNGIQARWEVNEMDHFLLRNYEKFKNDGKQKSTISSLGKSMPESPVVEKSGDN